MSELDHISEASQAAAIPRLQVELPSWPRVFFGNLRELVLPRRLPRLELRSAPAPFWHDVFVKRNLPWLSFLESFAYHTIVIALAISVSSFVAGYRQPTPRPTFDHTQVIYYEPAEYLPPIDTRNMDTRNIDTRNIDARNTDTRNTRAAAAAKADPVYARQPIISVPREADNRSQTIVTPPNVNLKHDVAMPNMVAWSDTAQKPRLAIPPVPLTPAAELTRLAPQMESSILAPPPDADHLAHRSSQPNLQTSVVAPPPAVESAPTRQLRELNIGRSNVIAPAPQLSVAEQRAVVSRRSSDVGVTPQVVPPPPSVSASGSGSVGSPGRVIALNLHPAVGAPPAVPAGNRRGEFAAAPEGHTGASGFPGASSGNAAGHASGTANGTGSNQNAKSDLPAGLYVGRPAPAVKTSPVTGEPSGSKPLSSSDPSPAASSATARGSSAARPVAPESAAKLSESERAVFGVRRLYSLTVNMPNLNSAGGSWVIRFAELTQDPGSPAGGLSEPVATRKVDPGYPTQLIRENVSGTVIVYAVIHADGTVGNVRVVRGVDDRLDRYACDAVARWRFQPAMKNGAPVEVEATFQIPFRPPKLGTNF
jgi:TonB family protein